MINEQYYVYILSNKAYGTLYTSLTSDLIKHFYQHKNNHITGLTKTYAVHQLVYFETYQNIHEAILREKKIKRWRRDWKINLIESLNPHWQDLYLELDK